MLDLNEAINHLSMENSAHCHIHVLRREDEQILKSTLELEVEGQRRKGKLKDMGEAIVGRM